MNLEMQTLIQEIEKKIQFVINRNLMEYGREYMTPREFEKKITSLGPSNNPKLSHHMIDAVNPINCIIEVYRTCTCGDEQINCVWFSSVSEKADRYGYFVCVDSSMSYLHKHSFFEFIYVLQGKYTAITEGSKHIYQEHELCLLDKKCSHIDLREECYGIVFFLSVRNIIFDNYFISNISSGNWRDFLLSMAARKRSTSWLSKRLDPDSSVQVEKLLAIIYNELIQRKPCFDKMIQIYIIRFINIVEGKSMNSPDATLHDSENTDKYNYTVITEFILNHLPEINLTMLSAEFNYQADYYNRIIKKHTGLTYSQFVNKEKMVRARTMLTMTDLSCAKIAEILGFSYPTYFYRAFKNFSGTSPKKYRNNHKDLL